MTERHPGIIRMQDQLRLAASKARLAAAEFEAGVYADPDDDQRLTVTGQAFLDAVDGLDKLLKFYRTTRDVQGVA